MRQGRVATILRETNFCGFLEWIVDERALKDMIWRPVILGQVCAKLGKKATRLAHLTEHMQKNDHEILNLTPYLIDNFRLKGVTTVRGQPRITQVDLNGLLWIQQPRAEWSYFS